MTISFQENVETLPHPVRIAETSAPFQVSGRWEKMFLSADGGRRRDRQTEGEKERHKDRQIDTQTDRQTDSQTDGKTDREKCIEADR